MPLQIPDRYRPGLLELATLSNDAYEHLGRALQGVSASQDYRTLLQATAPSLEEFDRERLGRILDSLTSLFRLKVRVKGDARSVAAEVAESFTLMNKEAGIVDAETLKDRLSHLLDIDSLDVFEPKATELQQEHERLLLEASLFTDIRPIFGDVVEEEPRSVVVTHTMKLLLRDKGASRNQSRELYFALDAKDIAALIETLKRAQTKESSINRLLSKTGVTTLDLSA